MVGGVELADAGDADGIEEIVVRARFFVFDQRQREDLLAGGSKIIPIDGRESDALVIDLGFELEELEGVIEEMTAETVGLILVQRFGDMGDLARIEQSAHRLRPSRCPGWIPRPTSSHRRRGGR